MHEVEFRVLGPLELTIGRCSVSLRGAKPQIVLASLLISENCYTSIDRLVDAVWGADPPSTAGKQIRNTVSALRSVLASSDVVITPVADGYRLDLGNARLDLLEFHRHTARAHRHVEAEEQAEAITEFRAALSQWSGPMLSGIESDTLHAQIAGMHEKRLSVIEECADLEITLGRHKNLLSELARWAAENPLRERLIAQYTLALHRSGARAEAFAVHERTRLQLAEQLGLSPGPELSTVYQLMLQEDTVETARPRDAAVISGGPGPALWPEVAPVPVPESLPPDITHFVGRTAEIRTLLEATHHSEARRVLAIDGMPGAGKTALAVHVAHRSTHKYPDGQHFLDLCGHNPVLDPLDHRTALRQLLLWVGVPKASLPHNAKELAALWRARTCGLRLLLVLDNAASARQIRPLLPAGNSCLTLVTSRRRLPMTTWSASRLLSLDSQLPRVDGYELFCLLLGRQHPKPGWAAVEDILELCGDLPLAISAAAALLRRRPSWQPAHLSERLSDHRLLLTALQTEQGDIVTCFDASFRHLNTEQQRLLRILGTTEGVSNDVATVSALTGVPPHVTEHMLEELVDEHLLLQSHPGRYEMHPLVKVYCAQAREYDRAFDPMWRTTASTMCNHSAVTSSVPLRTVGLLSRSSTSMEAGHTFGCPAPALGASVESFTT